MTQPIDFDVMTPGEAGTPGVSKSDRQLLTTLFALGREVASVLDLDELYRKLPGLIARITDFHAVAVYLIDPKQGDLPHTDVLVKGEKIEAVGENQRRDDPGAVADRAGTEMTGTPPIEARPAVQRGIKVLEDGRKVRIFKSTGEAVDI